MRFFLSIIVGTAIYMAITGIARFVLDIKPTFVEAMTVALAVIVSNVAADMIRGKP